MLGSAESEMDRLISREIIFAEFQPMWSRYLNVRDGRTDGRTTCFGNTALRGKNDFDCRRNSPMSLKCLVDQESQLEVDSLSDRQPVELPQHWRDMNMITSTSAGDEWRCRVLHRLEAPEQTVCDAAEQRVTVVKMRTNKTLQSARASLLHRRTVIL